MARHVPLKDQSKHAKKRKRSNLLKPFNLFATAQTLRDLNAMAKAQGFPSRAEMFRCWIREKLEQHEAKQAAKAAQAEAQVVG